MKLTICIPTIVGREKEFDELFHELCSQNGMEVLANGKREVEILWMRDNKEMSIGKKRQHLLNNAKGEYIVMIDEDDKVPFDYIHEVLVALKQRPDCVGYLEQCKINGHNQIACHSNRFADWATNQDGYDYVRTIFCKDVIRTDIARKIGFSDMRFAEDHYFAKRLKASGLLEKEIFIDKIMYYYTSNTLTPKQHIERYGLDKDKNYGN